MEKSKVDMYIGLNAENFNPQDLMVIKDKLEKMDEEFHECYRSRPHQ